MKTAYAFLIVGAMAVSAFVQPTVSVAQEPTNRTFTTTAPADWAERATAEKWIAELTPDQTVQGGIVSDPERDNIVYFATSAPVTTPAGEQGTLLSVYRYNTTSQIYERLWRSTQGSGDTEGIGGLAQWRVIGVDGNDVIVRVEPAGANIGACDQGVLTQDGATDVRLMRLPKTFAASWQSGLKEYTAPQEVMDQAQRTQDQCNAQ